MKIKTTLLIAVSLISTSHAATVSPKVVKTIYTEYPVGQPLYQVDELTDEVEGFYMQTAPNDVQKPFDEHKTLTEHFLRATSGDNREGLLLGFFTEKIAAASFIFGDGCTDFVAVYIIDDEKVIERESSVRLISSLHTDNEEKILTQVLFRPSDYAKLIRSDDTRIRFTLPGSDETVTLTVRSRPFA